MKRELRFGKEINLYTATCKLLKCVLASGIFVKDKLTLIKYLFNTITRQISLGVPSKAH